MYLSLLLIIMGEYVCVDDQLEGWTEGWMDGGMDGGMNGWMDGWMDGWKNGWRDGWMEGWMDGWMDGGMDGWMEGWMEGWMDEWMDFDYLIFKSSFQLPSLHNNSPTDRYKLALSYFNAKHRFLDLKIWPPHPVPLAPRIGLNRVATPNAIIDFFQPSCNNTGLPYLQKIQLLRVDKVTNKTG